MYLKYLREPFVFFGMRFSNHIFIVSSLKNVLKCITYLKSPEHAVSIIESTQS